MQTMCDRNYRSSRTRRTVCGLALTALALPVIQALADPAQLPLLVQENTPLPNVLLTIDDSGSMDWPFMPDSVGNLNYSCGFLCVSTISPYSYGEIVLDPTEAAGAASVVSTLDGDIFAARVRSSSINSIYYNPAIKYQPWPASLRNISSDLVDAQGNVSNPAKTPLDATGVDKTTIDLTQQDVVVKAPWCYNLTPMSGNLCSTTSQKYTPAVYFAFKGTAGNLKDMNDVSKFTRVVVSGDELKNFANWFTYYRKRILMAKGSTALAFDPYAGKQRFRLGYARINKGLGVVPNEGGYSSATLESGVRLFDESRRNQFSSWLAGLSAWGATPLRQALQSAGDYFSSDTMSSTGTKPVYDPYRTDPTNSASPILSCRQNYHVLVTDGYWNASDSSVRDDVQSADTTNGPQQTGTLRFNGNDVPATYGYSVDSQYAGASGKTLANVAMFYWKNDLRPDLNNNVPPATCSKASATDVKGYLDSCADPAFWQHMVNYTVGLGVDGTLAYPSGKPPGTTDKPTSWPTPSANSPETIDDLWHAAVNSRGNYLKVTDPLGFAKSMGAILQSITSRQGSSAGVSTASQYLQASNFKYVPTFNSGIWSGDLAAYQLDSAGNVLTPNTPAWLASKNVPDPSVRNIAVWQDVTHHAIPFVTGGLPADMLAQIDVSGSASAADLTNLINFVRGQAIDGLRVRDPNSILGDIVNSPPRYIKATDFGNGFLPAKVGATSPVDTGLGKYADYLSAKKARTQGVIAFGANDGMFHIVEESDGKEVFALIPRAVLPKLQALAAVPYVHEFTVDGPSTEADVYDGSAWNNIVVATAGAGAKSLFAIQVLTSSPTTFDGTKNVLWEWDGSGDNNLGYVLSAPQVGMLPNGKWVAVFGNGFDSVNGHAYLYVCDALRGCDSSATAQPPIQAGADTGNGLGGVVLIRDSHGIIRGAYAGDLKGHIWKFVANDDSGGYLKLDLGGSPLFTAAKLGVPQPIMAPPAYALNDGGGLLVVVSTGKLYAESDRTTADTQTIYGLKDPAPIGVSTSASPSISTSDLLSEVSDNSNLGSGYFTIAPSSSAPAPTPSKGWMLDMTLATGERGIYQPRFISGILEVETVVPGITAGESCSASGRHYVYLLNPMTGGQLATKVVDAYGFPVGGFVMNGLGQSGLLGDQPGNGSPTQSDKLLDSTNTPYGLTFGKPPNQRIWQPILNAPNVPSP